MNFVSITFIIFLIITLILWNILSHSYGKMALCISNCIFYGYWYPPFILLLLTSGLIDYISSRRINRHPKQAKLWLCLSIGINLGVLFFFKYANFFIDTLDYLSAYGEYSYFSFSLNVILPMGISFYTFQSMSYTIDVYRGKIESLPNFTDFFLYLSFFPQLVAGPIVRAIDFLPQLQIRSRVTLDDWVFAIYRITRGLYLKVVIADNIGIYVNAIFAGHYQDMHFIEAWIGAISFAIQILCDFSGYSDIAIGTSRLFGFRIMENFNNPYLATNLQDFWARWHISLSTWFRDYLYIPLGGSRISILRTCINILTVFVISGLWHGANWTFILWGGIHGLGLLLYRYFTHLKHRVRIQRPKPWLSSFIKLNSVVLTFLLVSIAWVPFRVDSIAEAINYWSNMFPNQYSISSNTLNTSIIGALFWISIFMFYQLVINSIKYPDNAPQLKRKAIILESLVYYGLVLLLPGPKIDFIYFQF